MDEKSSDKANVPATNMRGKRSRLALVGGLVVLFLVGLYSHGMLTITCGIPHRLTAGRHPHRPTTTTPVTTAPTDKRPVALEAHIMSKCPDAQACLKDLVLPTMMRVHDKVDFTLSYIGQPTENDGVDCMHGPEECMGNIIQLCAAALYPEPKTYLGFTMCLMRDYEDIPHRSLIEDCALEHAIDFAALNECATRDNGAYGMGMLRSSVRHTQDVSLIRHQSGPRARRCSFPYLS